MSSTQHICHDLMIELSTGGPHDEMLESGLVRALEITGAHMGAIHVVDEGTGALDITAHKGLPPNVQEALSHYPPGSRQAVLAVAGRPFYRAYLTGVSTDGEASDPEPLHTVATVPIRQQGGTIALLSIISRASSEIPAPCRIDLETIGAFMGVVLFKHKLEKANTSLEGQLEQSQKLEALGTLAGGIAHDMNNLLGGIMGLATLLREETNSQDVRFQDIEKILEAARRGSTLTQNLLNFARKGKHDKKGISINRVVRQVEQLLERTILKKIVISAKLDDSIARVEGDSGQLTHALMNLCLNAIDAMGGEGALVISTSNTILNDATALPYPNMRQGLYSVLEVTDSGRGMDPGTLDHVFEPFFTTKEQGHGTGLGLPMVYNTVRNHNGAIAIESELGKGTVVRILLPAFESSLPKSPASQDFNYRVEGGHGTILLVDDEEIIRTTGQRLLEKLGYSVILAENGKVALEIFVDRHRGIDLVILDMAMPVLDGAQCLTQLKEINPSVPVLISSGLAVKKTEKIFEHHGINFLAKPFDIEQLADAVAKAISD